MLQKPNLSAVCAAVLLSACGLQKPTSSSSTPVVGLANTCTATTLTKIDEEGPYLQGNTSSEHGPLKKLRGQIPSLTKSLDDRGETPGSQVLEVTVVLQLNNEEELDRRIAEIYTPGHPNFHRFMTTEEFRDRHAPTEAQVNQVLSFLSTQNVVPLSLSEGRRLIRAMGKINSFNTLFHTSLHNFRDKQGREFYAPAYEFQIPDDLPVQAVHGLHNIGQFKSFARHQESGNLLSPYGTGPNGGLSPADIRKAYNMPSDLDGAGQSLALFELDGYTASDITKYEQQFNLPSVPLRNVLVSGAKGTAGSGADEVTLDIELMIAVAPGISQILVYEGANTEQGSLATFGKIADDNLANQISTSWGSTEGDTSSSFVQSENSIFKQMAAQGQSFYSASGDSGAYADNSNISVTDPSSQPFAVSVGGTRLSLDSNGSYKSETTWNANGSPSGGGGGGGISKTWPIPDWQKSAITSASLGSTTMRNIPDVALDSDPATGYSIYYSGRWATFGGTSCAAPIWAAYTALINQRRISYGLTTLGFPNLAFYQIGQGAQYSSAFFDIADGSTNMKYPAISGYDDATGWGSMNGIGLLDALAQDPKAAPAPTPSSAPTSGCTRS